MTIRICMNKVQTNVDIFLQEPISLNTPFLYITLFNVNLFFLLFSPFFRFSIFFSAFHAFLSVFLCIFAKEY